MVELQAFFDKVTTYNIEDVVLCSGKDLVAVRTEDDSVVVMRIAHQPKKVAALDETVKINSIAFKEDGTGIVLSTSTGLIKIFHLESMGLSLFHEISLHKSPIPFLSWHSFRRDYPDTHYPIEALIPPHNLVSKFSDFSLIFSVDDSSFISLTVNGVFPLAFFQSPGCKESRPTLDLNSMCLLKNLEDEWRVELWDIRVIEKKSKEINELADIFRKSQELLKILNKGAREVTKEVNSVIASYTGRFLNGIEDSIGKAAAIEEVLSIGAATGIVWNFLSKFLKEEMQNTKAILQYEEKLAVQVKNCQITLIQDCKNSVTSLIFYLTTLKNYSKVPSYAPLGLANLELDQMIEMLQEFYKKTVNMMELLSDAHFDIKNMIHWLHNWTLKLVKEEEQGEPPEEWQVDLKKLMAYFQSETSLYFTQLVKIIKSEYIEDLNKISKSWSELITKMPLNLPKYFRKTQDFSLSRFLYSGFNLKVTQDIITIALYSQARADLFTLKSNQITVQSFDFNFAVKFLSLCKEEKIVVAGNEGLKTVVACLDRSGKNLARGEFGNEDISAFAFDDGRMVAVTVTNERTLRVFDLEEID